MRILTFVNKEFRDYRYPKFHKSLIKGTRGKRVGIAYELKGSEIIYVPE